VASEKPYVALACLCEKTLLEKDEVLSIVRIIDTFQIEAPQDGTSWSVPPLQFWMVISLRSGAVRGKFDLGLALQAPSGINIASTKWPIVLEGEDRGATVTTRISLALEELGLYWFDVLWEGELLTRIPFRLTGRAAPDQTTPQT
jgi:hypothetical protein